MSEKRSSDKVSSVSIEVLTISPFNVRKEVGDILDLQKSIESIGLLQPIVVRTVDDKLEVVIGQRRFLACKALGWKTIPAIRREVPDREALILSLTENVHMDTLDPVDRSEGTKRLIKDLESEMSRTQAVEWVAKKLGKHQSTIYDWLRLLETSEGIKAMIREKRIDTKTGARLASLPKEVQEDVAEIIHEEYLPQPRALKVIEQVREKLKVEPTLKTLEVTKEAIEESEEYSINVSFSGSLFKALSKLAQEKKLTIQEIIRRAVKKYLNL